jgi:von Willebrand factor type A domain
MRQGLSEVYMRPWLVGFSLLAAACSTTGRNEGTGSSGGGTNGSTTAGTTGGGGLVNPGDNTGTNGGATGGTTGGDNCGVQNFMLVHGNIPELLIVQDRSGSMSLDPSGGILSGNKDPQSRWMQVVTAIEQTVTNNNMIWWGLEMYPDPNADPLFGTGCEIESNLDVPVAMGDGAMVKSKLDAASPDGLTPTADALKAAVNYFSGTVDSDGHPKYILLATDGEPNCGSGSDDNAEAEQAVSDAAAKGIHTFVVGIGTGNGNEQVLTQMAMNGMEPNMTAGQKPYYEVSSTADLTAALTKITGQLVSCSYALQMPPMNPDLVTINAGSKMVPRDPTHMNGWDFGPGDMTIVFYGAACTDLQTGIVQTVSAIYGCPPVS